MISIYCFKKRLPEKRVLHTNNPAGNCMLKFNNRNTRARCEICSKLTIKTPEGHQWRRYGSGVFNVNLVILLLTLSR